MYHATCPVICIPLLLLIAPADRATASDRSAVSTALESITIDELDQLVTTLADDTFEGRKAGSRGGRAASRYLIQQFQQLGLQPAATDRRYDQPFRKGYRNLLGRIDGSDSELADQILLIGAHYDHVGYGNNATSYGPIGHIHNGADDNASGTAAVLEVADAIAKLPVAPKRTVLFALWDGEEQGLLGSRHWIQNPTISLDRLVMTINLDMIGRLREQKLEVPGTRTASGMRQWISRRNTPFGLQLLFSWSMNENSDHYPFFKRGIPTLMFHTGTHEDYHRPSDDADRINMDGLQQVTQFVFRCTYDLTNQPDIWEFRAESRRERDSQRRSLEQSSPAAPPRLGVSWTSAEEPTEGLTLTRIARGSPAYQAGLRVGDTLTHFQNLEIRSSQLFQSQVLFAPPTVSLVAQRPGAAAPIELAVQLDGKPVRWGISWREDAGEPGSLVLVQVTPHSPAHSAGLQIRDRIYEVDGRPFQNGNKFMQLANSLYGPVPVLVERQGRLEMLTVNLPAHAAAE